MSNAKHIVGDSYHRFGIDVHVTANTSEDLNNALMAFGQVSGVSKITTIAIHVAD